VILTANLKGFILSYKTARYFRRAIVQTTFDFFTTLAILHVLEVTHPRGVGDSHLARAFLNMDALDRVVVCDNDKALEHGKKEHKPVRLGGVKCVSAYLGTWSSKASGGIQHQAEARDEQSAIVCNEADGFIICAKQQHQKYKEKSGRE
jgi:hypothetical protein